jgi:hypothetical protein
MKFLNINPKKLVKTKTVMRICTLYVQLSQEFCGLGENVLIHAMVNTEGMHSAWQVRKFQQPHKMRT